MQNVCNITVCRKRGMQHSVLAVLIRVEVRHQKTLVPDFPPTQYALVRNTAATHWELSNIL